LASSGYSLGFDLDGVVSYTPDSQTVELSRRWYLVKMDRFPKLPHQSAGGGIECCGRIIPEGWPIYPETTLRCNECAVVVGTINTGILNDIITLARATEMDKFVPDADHINALPGPLRRYVHDLEIRADPAGDVAEIAMLKENNAAVWARIRELESDLPQQSATSPPASS